MRLVPTVEWPAFCSRLIEELQDTAQFVSGPWEGWQNIP